MPDTTEFAARSGSAPWYQRDPADVLAATGSRPAGLTEAEARERLARHGYNELAVHGRSALVRLLLQFHNAMIYILLVAACVTGLVLDERVDTLVILAVVVLNVIIGYVQEGKAEAAIEALKRMIVAECTVLRDGRKRVIATREVVPGDIVLLEAGSRVPADLRLLQARNLCADEAPLTGESVPVGKHTAAIGGDHLGPGDQRNMAFSGTFITRGTARGVVTGTGPRTEFGKIAALMQETPKIVTPLVRKINEFTRFLIVAIMVIAAANFALGVWFEFPVEYSFLASVALAVAAIPEMLPAIVVAILALASTAMARRRALVRKLPAAETLGCASVICSDKTGTLTRNEMTVVRLFAGGRRYRVTGSGYEPAGQFLHEGAPVDLELAPELRETLRAAAWCNDTEVEVREGRHVVVGDPTEAALVVAAAKAGVPGGRASRLDEIPFESENRYMATLHAADGHNLIFVKGSPETVLGFCESQLLAGVAEPIVRETVLAEAEDMAREALRVLGKAFKRVPQGQTRLTPDDLRGLTFLGLSGMIDPPRVEVIEAVRKCRTAGIRVVMITGDHAATARAIARDIGIIDGAGEVVTGEAMSAMDDDALHEAVGRVSVFARSAPEHKLRIAQQLQRRGAIVAMTGDGVNDAPALRAADIGVAMGVAGTEVSKESADMVLADDNFASIVAAIEEGRHAWRNFQKAVLYTLPTNGGQALLVMGAIALAPLFALFAVRLPLEPIHILWVNLADSVFLTLPLMMEPKEAGLLDGPPRDPDEPIANRLFIERVLLVSVLMAATGFATYYWFGAPAITAGADGHQVDALLLAQAQTAAFVAIQLLHLGFLATARSVHRSAFTFSPFSNPWVLGGMALTVACQLAIVYVPVLQAVFRTAPLPLEWWPILALGLLPGFIGVEIEKVLRDRSAPAGRSG